MEVADQADPDNLWYLLDEAHKHLEAQHGFQGVGAVNDYD